MTEIAYVGSKGSNLIWAFNPNEVQPGLGSQASRRLIQPLSNLSNMTQFDPTNSSSFNSLQVKVVKRYARWSPVPHGLHLRQVARLRGRARLGRRRRGRPAERDALRGEPRTLGLRRQAPLRAELRVGPSLRHRSPVRERRHRQRPLRRLAVQRDRDPDHRAALHRRSSTPASTTARRPGPTASATASSTTRPSIAGSTSTDFKAPTPNTYGTSGRGVLYAPGVQTVDASLTRRFPLKGDRVRRPVPGRRLQPAQHPAVRLPERQHRLAHRGPDHVAAAGHRQPPDAVLGEAGLLTTR